MFYKQFIYLAHSFAYASNNIYQSYFMLVSRIVHIKFMNIQYNSHIFRNILQSSFENSRKFKNILHYSSNFYVFPGDSRKFYIFLVSSKIFQVFLRCFQKFPLILSLQIVMVTTQGNLLYDKISAFLDHFFSGHLQLFHLIFIFSIFPTAPIFLLHHSLIPCLLLLGLLETFCGFWCYLVIIQPLLQSLLQP